MCAYICITESLCCTAEINIVNQLYFNKKKKDPCLRVAFVCRILAEISRRCHTKYMSCRNIPQDVGLLMLKRTELSC